MYNGFYAKIDNRKFNTWCKYTSRIDTYGCGCEYNCSYCYSRHLLSFRKHWNPNNPKIAIISEIEKKISTLDKSEVVKIGGLTDCFQSIEIENEVTYETIKLLNQYHINYLIVTKSDLVSTDKYLNIYDDKLAHFQITITSTNDNIRKEYEGGSNILDRIFSIELLHHMGFDVSIRLSPFIFDNINFNILNNIKCDKILVEFLKVSHFVKKSFNIDYSKYTYKFGGYQHLELTEKINQLKSINNFDKISVGEYVKDHYIYFRDKVNYNRNDCCNLDIKNKEFYSKIEQLDLFK